MTARARDVNDYEGPRHRKKIGIGTVLLIAGAVVVGLLVLLLTIGAIFYATAEELPITDAERGIVTTASYLAEWSEDLDPSLGVESLNMMRFIDGTVDLEYEYEHPDSDENSFLYISCAVTIDTSATDARITYETEGAGASFGFGLFGVERQDRPDLFSWGRKSDSALLIGEDGAVVGNYFACLKGQRSFRWIVVGLYWDEPGSLREVLEPVLERLEDYEP
jgi:hypothetical protein